MGLKIILLLLLVCFSKSFQNSIGVRNSRLTDNSRTARYDSIGSPNLMIFTDDSSIPPYLLRGAYNVIPSTKGTSRYSTKSDHASSSVNRRILNLSSNGFRPNVITSNNAILRRNRLGDNRNIVTLPPYEIPIRTSLVVPRKPYVAQYSKGGIKSDPNGIKFNIADSVSTLDINKLLSLIENQSTEELSLDTSVNPTIDINAFESPGLSSGSQQSNGRLSTRRSVRRPTIQRLVPVNYNQPSRVDLSRAVIVSNQNASLSSELSRPTANYQVGNSLPYNNIEQIVLPFSNSPPDKPYGSSEESKPYVFGYSIDDGLGNLRYRQENSDDAGTVTGSYGYTDNLGVYRHVNYVADGSGFKAVLNTNEPGTDNRNPADIYIVAEQPSAGSVITSNRYLSENIADGVPSIVQL